MRKRLLLRSTLLLVLVTAVAVAKVREPIERALILSEHPRNEAPRVYVGGRIATLLRLEKPCDSGRTAMLGWEGHFEPVVCVGRWVLLYPLRDLTPEDRFLLRVTLTDGTELPFIVTSHEQSYGDREVDQQVEVFASREGYDAVLASLYRALQSERELRAQVERYQKEENSIDHAYATLLANGVVKQAPFRRKISYELSDGDVDMKVEILSGKGNGKAAVVVQLANTHRDEPWTLKEARVSSDLTSRTARPFALRMNRAEIVSGASGTLAVVVDKSAFVSEKGMVSLVLEIFRDDGLQQLSVLLDPRLVQE
ncbi:DUF2381 family protein [Archangium sp.]|uniref:DUF2381 family protein n=1 Tax=Archangium sp. TaxID=1872627 RepID=UPI002D644F1B|nr:DUF2381 family protein [Archangium sp.]HYO58039.1 DUF2381 family protein [Archangium sp.]